MSAAGSSKYVPESLEVEDVFEAPSTYAKNTVGLPEVRTLKPPPEIWELVHPVAPRRRSPIMAFVNRITSNGTTLMILIFAALALGGVSAFLIVRPDKLEAKTTPKTPAVQRVRATQSDTGSSSQAAPPENPSASDAAIDLPPTTATAVGEVPTTPGPKKARTAKKPVSISPEVVAERVSADRAQSRPVVEGNTEKKNSLDSAAAKPKANASESPQLAVPAKPTESPKAKVIPWP